MTSNSENRIQNFINGKFVSHENNETFQNINPANEECLSTVEVALETEVNAAVAAAQAAQVKWRELTGAERGRILVRTANILRERNAELAALEVMDSGKPISEALSVDIQSGADALEYFGGVAASLKGDHYQLGKNFAYARREPIGVVGGIGAWNYPIQIACWKSAPALAAGNAMIFKPSELTPTTATYLAKIFQEAGLPDGVFNVVQGNARTGQLLVEHPGIDKISLTGEVGTGRKVMGAAAKRLKHVSLELGGKSPLIIFEDAKLDSAVEGAFLANFYTQGEVCTNGTRVFVHRSILNTFLEKMVKRTEGLRVGDPMDAKTEVGALISREHLDRVLGFVERGEAEGAKLLCGGRKVGTKGNFMSPAVFSNCHDEMSIVKEEIFGPVMSVLVFDDEEEVIRRANATDFGLASGVFTQDLNRAHRVASRMEAGTCWINTYNIAPVEVPFGGWKQSGLGVENSQWALEHYTRLKVVYVETGEL